MSVSLSLSLSLSCSRAMSCSLSFIVVILPADAARCIEVVVTACCLRWRCCLALMRAWDGGMVGSNSLGPSLPRLGLEGEFIIR